MTTTNYQNLPNAATVAQRLGGRTVGENDWRIPHVCGGAAPGTSLGDNPGLSVADGDPGLIVKCFYGCENAAAYAAVSAALGISHRPPMEKSPRLNVTRLRCPNCFTEGLTSKLIPGTGWPALSCGCGASYDRLLSVVAGEQWTAWAEYMLADGKPRRMVRPYPTGRYGAKSTWAREPAGPDGKRPRRSARELMPLVWGEDVPGNTLVVVEGEKAAAAGVSATLNAGGYTPVSTQSAAGMANANYAVLVQGRDVIVWADADEPNVKTGRKAGPEAAQKAASRILDARAVSVRMVDPDAAAALVPDTGKRQGADAADVPPDLMRDLLAQSTEYVPASDATTKDLTGYPWYAAGDFLPPWDCTPDADCMRTMRRHAADLLVVIPDDGSRSYLRAVSNGDVWAKSDDAIDHIIADTALEWATHALRDKDVDRNLAAHVVRWQKRLSATTGRNAAQDSVGRVRLRWRDDGMAPPSLTQCRESEIDASRRYIGAPNGVIDLDTGRLITGAAARSLLVSRSVADPYDPEARHPAIEGLLNHLGEDERRYLLAALGFALRGNPARRFYLLAGHRNGGKTTVLAAAKACVGDVKAGGYGMTIQPSVLLTDRLQHANGHQGGLYGVQDARIATVSEIPDGRGKFNTGLLKTLTGGDYDSIRDVGEKAGPSRPATATVFVAANPPDFDRLDLTDSALEDRARILPYPTLPNDRRNPDVLNTVQNDPKARQTMLAMMVRSATAFAENPYPPADIPSVVEAVEERRQASIGEVGQWLRDNVVVTRRGDHLLTTDDLISALAITYPPDDKGRYAGQSRKNVLAMAREVVAGLPAAKVSSVGGHKGRGYRGVRLATEAELQAHFEEVGDNWGTAICVQCGGDNDGNELTPDQLCIRCALESQSTMLAPAAVLERLAEMPPTDLATTSPDARRRAADNVERSFLVDGVPVEQIPLQRVEYEMADLDSRDPEDVAWVVDMAERHAEPRHVARTPNAPAE